jgi:hypothetical protein
VGSRALLRSTSSRLLSSQLAIVRERGAATGFECVAAPWTSCGCGVSVRAPWTACGARLRATRICGRQTRQAGIIRARFHSATT